jgi:hypothetical protein
MEQLLETGNTMRPDADLLNDKRFNSSIESIARELAVPIDDVVARYQATLDTLLPQATVNDYVAILAEKKVKAVYRAGYRMAEAARYAS